MWYRVRSFTLIGGVVSKCLDIFLIFVKGFVSNVFRFEFIKFLTEVEKGGFVYLA